MANWKNEEEAREQIKALVADFYHDLKNRRNPRQILSRETVSVMRLVFTMKKRCAL